MPADQRRCALYRLAGRRILDAGCGVGPAARAAAAPLPGARYTGLEFSDYLCRRYGWRQGTIQTLPPRERFDLVICYDVLQYLSAAAARAAIAKLGEVCRGALYFGALTSGDWRDNCDAARTDRIPGLRSGSWYRRELSRAFRPLGCGMWLRRGLPVTLWDLDRPPMSKLLLMLLKFAKFGPVLKSAGLHAVVGGCLRPAVRLALCAGLCAAAARARDGALRGGTPPGNERWVADIHPFCGRLDRTQGSATDGASRRQHIAFAGPFAGTLAAAAEFMAFALRTHSMLLLALAYAGFFLNLFNLIPITPFRWRAHRRHPLSEGLVRRRTDTGGGLHAESEPDVSDDPAVAGADDLRLAARGVARGSRRPTIRATTKYRWTRACAMPATICCCSGSCVS